MSKKPGSRSDEKKTVQSGTDTQPFLTDVKALRARARKNIDDGAVTEGYAGDRAAVLKLLNDARGHARVDVHAGSGGRGSGSHWKNPPS